MISFGSHLEEQKPMRFRCQTRCPGCPGRAGTPSHQGRQPRDGEKHLAYLSSCTHESTPKSGGREARALNCAPQHNLEPPEVGTASTAPHPHTQPEGPVREYTVRCQQFTHTSHMVLTAMLGTVLSRSGASSGPACPGEMTHDANTAVNNLLLPLSKT